MSENTRDLSGFDPANKDLDPKLFIVERCLELLQRIEKRNIDIWDRLVKNDIGGAMQVSLDIRANLDYLGANGYLGRLQQHLANPAASCSKIDSDECEDDHQPEKVIKLISATSLSELAGFNHPVVRVFRIWPIPGFIQKIPIPTTISSIIETVGRNSGGGNYQIQVVDKDGVSLATSLFQIAGEPRNQWVMKPSED